MAKLKGLFKTEKNKVVQEKTKVTLINYHERGFIQAKNTFGKIPALKLNLYRVYRDYRQILKDDEAKQNSLKEPIKIKLGELNTKNITLNEEKEDIENNKIPNFKKKIEEIQIENDTIKKNPQDYIGEKVEKASFYIGAFILSCLTIYLYIFYSSASYSGFFRIFEPGISLKEAMLAPNAFVKAWNDGIGEFAFILFMPFVFIALGYLIHKFSESKKVINYFKIALLLIVTFVFDGFLAFKISEGLESVNQTLLSTEYTVNNAFQDVNFWVVIFSGFVAYVVWGLVFDFVMIAYHKLDKVSVLIKINNEKINRREQDIEELKSNIDKIKQEVSNNNVLITNCETKLDSFIFDPEEFGTIHSQFMTGWIQYMAATHLGDDLIEEAESISTIFLTNNNK